MMNQLDLLLQNSLASLAAGYDDEPARQRPESLELGCVAFFRESSWKPYAWHRNARQNKRHSHPGLSIASGKDQVAYGSSRIEGREPQTTLLVKPTDCSLLNRPTAFLLQYSAPLNIFDIDFRKTAIAEISSKLKKELNRKLAGV
jgi:hypothetical protein